MRKAAEAEKAEKPWDTRSRRDHNRIEALEKKIDAASTWETLRFQVSGFWMCLMPTISTATTSTSSLRHERQQSYAAPARLLLK